MKRKMKNGPMLIGPEKYLIMDYLLVLLNLEAPGSKYRCHVEQPMKCLIPNLILDLNLHLLNLQGSVLPVWDQDLTLQHHPFFQPYPRSMQQQLSSVLEATFSMILKWIAYNGNFDNFSKLIFRR